MKNSIKIILLMLLFIPFYSNSYHNYVDSPSEWKRAIITTYKDLGYLIMRIEIHNYKNDNRYTLFEEIIEDEDDIPSISFVSEKKLEIGTRLFNV